MGRKALAAAAVVAVFLGLCVGMIALSSAGSGDAGFPQPIQADSPCPATKCADGRCHGYEDVPEPDGVSLMTCPESPCTSEECHGWDALTGRYHKASDASLNLWILLPVALVVGLVVIVKRVR